MISVLPVRVLDSLVDSPFMMILLCLVPGSTALSEPLLEAFKIIITAAIRRIVVFVVNMLLPRLTVMLSAILNKMIDIVVTLIQWIP